LKGLIESSELQLNNTKQECADEEVAYNTAKAQRENERALLEELIKYFNENVVGATQNVND